MVMGSARDQNTARLGDGLQSGRDVNTVAIEVAALDHYVAKIYAYAQDDVAILGFTTIGNSHPLL